MPCASSFKNKGSIEGTNSSSMYICVYMYVVYICVGIDFVDFTQEMFTLIIMRRVWNVYLLEEFKLKCAFACDESLITLRWPLWGWQDVKIQLLTALTMGISQVEQWSLQEQLLIHSTFHDSSEVSLRFTISKWVQLKTCAEIITFILQCTLFYFRL